MMDEAERRAFAALRFNRAHDDVWRTTTFHVEGLHRDVLRSVLDGVAEAEAGQEDGSSPIGVAVLGTRGTGKTHLLGSLREHVQRDGGYFFLVGLLEASAFWRSTALSLLDGFARPTPDGQTQLTVFLRRLAELVGAPRLVRRAVLGEYGLTRSTLDVFVDLIRKADRQVGVECQDTVRALVLQAAEQPRSQDVGYEFLCSNDEVEAGERLAWGIRRGKRSAQEIVRDVSRLLALTGPTVIAVDQIDLLIAQSVNSSEGDARAEWRTSLLLEQIAGGLMDLRENTRRSLSVVTCTPQTWEQIRTQATDTVRDRFRQALWLRNIPSPELGRELVARRFAERFAGIGFEPPSPTWPVRDAAFERAVELTPRELLKTIDAHVRGCLVAGHARELESLLPARPAVADGPPGGTAPDSAAGLRPGLTTEPAEDIPADLAADLPVEVPDDGLPVASTAFAAIDERYAQLLRQADPAPALLPASEDTTVPALLAAGLTAWIAERGPAGDGFSLDPQPGGKPALHARLRLAGDEDTDDEEHRAFRAVHAPNHIAALNRVRNAVTAAGLGEGVSRRRLFLLRNQPWSADARTQETVAAFTSAGGRTLAFPEPDVARLVALEGLLGEYGAQALLPWLRARRPTDAVTFLREALGDIPQPPPARQVPARPPQARAAVTT